MKYEGSSQRNTAKSKKTLLHYIKRRAYLLAELPLIRNAGVFSGAQGLLRQVGKRCLSGRKVIATS
jgi:hypothetical protein